MPTRPARRGAPPSTTKTTTRRQPSLPDAGGDVPVSGPDVGAAPAGGATPAPAPRAGAPPAAGAVAADRPIPDPLAHDVPQPPGTLAGGITTTAAGAGAVMVPGEPDDTALAALGPDLAAAGEIDRSDGATVGILAGVVVFLLLCVAFMLIAAGNA